MTYGAVVTNNSGQVLISTEVTSLHFLGLAKVNGVNIDSIYNASMALTTIPGYGGSSSLSGRWVTTYLITSASPVVFFIHPRPNFYGRFYGILKQWSVGNNRYVDVMHTGDTWWPPRVLAFTQPNAIANNSETMGIIAYSSDGTTPTFDSRKKPLGIYWADLVVPPQVPCDGGTPGLTSYSGWRDTYLDFDFNSNNTYSTWNFSSPQYVEQYDLMFNAASSAQAVYSRQKNGFFQSSGFLSTQDHYSTTLWWVMYHQLYRINSWNSFSAGWGPFAAGYQYTETYEGGGWFGGSGGGYSTGIKPFSDQTINYDYNTAMIGVASLYYNQNTQPNFSFPFTTPNEINMATGVTTSTYQVNTSNVPNGATLVWAINVKYADAKTYDFAAISGTFYNGNNFSGTNGAGYFNITGVYGNTSGFKTYYVDIYYQDELVLSTRMHGYLPGRIQNLDNTTGGGDGSVSIHAYMPYTNKLAGQMLAGDPLLLLGPDYIDVIDGIVISNRTSTQKLLTLVSSSGIKLTCSDNTPLTLQDGSSINSTEALGNLLPVQDHNGFRWEEIVEIIDAGFGEVATIFCDNQCYAAGDEPDRWIWTHNLIEQKQ